MTAIPASAIIFTTLLVGLLTTGVLVLLPSTWQGDGRALRYWVIGNLALSLDRVYVLLSSATSVDTRLALLEPLAAALVVLGAAMHVAAMRLLLRSERRAMDWRWPAALACAQAAIGWSAGELALVRPLMMVATSLCIVMLLVICWPQRRQLRGALVMSGAMAFLLLMNLGGLWEFARAPAVHPQGTVAPIPAAILALDLVLSVVVNLAFLLILIELLQQRVERLSVTDPLTGVLNRRGFLQAANLQLLQANRRGSGHRAASVLLLDLDHFKRINDSLGHPMGDAVLRGAAARAAGAVRQTDVVARWGGEEFVVMLPGSRLPQAHEVAERLRLAIAQAPLADGAPIVTVSIGVAALDEVLAIDQLPALIAEADRRLYAAKRLRNCVVVHDGDIGQVAAASADAPALPALPAAAQGTALARTVAA